MNPKAPFRQLLQMQENHTDKKSYNASNCKPASTSAEIHQRSGECNMQDTVGLNQVPYQAKGKTETKTCEQSKQHSTQCMDGNKGPQFEALPQTQEREDPKHAAKASN